MMADIVEQLREHLAGLRAGPAPAGCLPRTTVEALADGSLPSLDAAAGEHFRTCLKCLGAYAEVGSLLEAATPQASTPADAAERRPDERRASAVAVTPHLPSFPEGVLALLGAGPAEEELRSRLEAEIRRWEAATPQTPEPAPGRRLGRAVGRLLTARIGIGWAAAAVVAAMVGTWLVSSRIYLQDPPEFSAAVHKTTLAGLLAAAKAPFGGASERVIGVVESIHDTTTSVATVGHSASLTMHVIQVRPAGGELYRIVVWGPPIVGVGDGVVVEGAFTRAGEVGGRPLFTGVATALGPAR